MTINYNMALFVFFVFLVLKLFKVIAWSWLWVTSPLWIPVAFFLCLFALALVGKIFLACIETLPEFMVGIIILLIIAAVVTFILL